jgi:hypothetical protein
MAASEWGGDGGVRVFANAKIQDLTDTDFNICKHIHDDPQFGKYLLDWLFDRYSQRMSP